MSAPRSIRPALVCASGAVVVAMAGGLLTEIGPWYYALVQPAWKPPDWAFGPVWTLIFGLAAASATLAWTQAQQPMRRRVVALFLLNGVLNVLWSLLYFKLRRPDWALAEVVLLWLSVALLIHNVRGLSRRAAWMLVPYLVWVAVAAALNYETVRLNGPFA